MIYIIIIIILFLIYIIIRFCYNDNFASTNITNILTNQSFLIQNTSNASNNFPNFLISQSSNDGTLNISFTLKTNITNGQEIFKLSGKYVDDSSIINVLEILFTQNGGFQINTGYSSETFYTKSYYLTDNIIMILITIKNNLFTISLNDNISFNYIETFNTAYPLNSGRDYNINTITYGSYNNTISNMMYILNINLYYNTPDILYSPTTNILTLPRPIISNFPNNTFIDKNTFIYYYVFKSNTTITVPFSCNLNYLCVGGGGGSYGYGGGGGGFVTSSVQISKGTNITITIGKGGDANNQGGTTRLSFNKYIATATGGTANNGDSIINNVTISGFLSGTISSSKSITCTESYKINTAGNTYQTATRNVTVNCSIPLNKYGVGGGAGGIGNPTICQPVCPNTSQIIYGNGGIGKQWSTCIIPSLRTFYWSGGGSAGTGGLGGGGGIPSNNGEGVTTVFNGNFGSIDGGANTGGGGGGTTGKGGDGIIILIFY